MDLMAMCSTRMIVRPLTALAVLLALAGCADTRADLSPDFGNAVRANLAAQIADPEARYDRVLQPGGDGARAALAATRYGKNQVIAPASASTSSIEVKGGAKGAGPAN
jgi:type IV pilus biogenesis protein CpaD/CtpE